MEWVSRNGAVFEWPQITVKSEYSNSKVISGRSWKCLFFKCKTLWNGLSVSRFWGLSRTLRKCYSYLRHAFIFVCPPAWNNSSLTGRIFIKFDIWVFFFFRKPVDKIEVSLNSDKNNGYFTWRPMYIYDNICPSPFKMINVSDKNCTEKIRTHILCSVTVFPKNRALNEIMCERYGIDRRVTDRNIARRMRFECWIPKATNTHSEYVIFIASLRGNSGDTNVMQCFFVRTFAFLVLRAGVMH
jgi:hypothetical protein